MRKNTRGFSLIEILVVMGVFAMLAVTTTAIISFSIRGTKKSEVTGSVRLDIDTATALMTRQLRNARAIVSCTENPETINFTDQRGAPNSFSCLGVPPADSYIASSSANIRLTSVDTDILSCNFTCVEGAAGKTDSIVVEISAKDKNTTGIETAQIDYQTQIVLRNY